MSVKLIKLTKDYVEHIRTIYKWNIPEKRKDLYSCDEIDNEYDFRKVLSTDSKDYSHLTNEQLYYC